MKGLISIIKAEIYKSLCGKAFKILCGIMLIYSTLYLIDFRRLLFKQLKIDYISVQIAGSNILINSGINNLLMYMIPIIIILVFTEDYQRNNILRCYDSVKSRGTIFWGKYFSFLILTGLLVFGTGIYLTTFGTVAYGWGDSSVVLGDIFMILLKIVFAYTTYGTLSIVLSVIIPQNAVVIIFYFVFSIIDSIIYSIVINIRLNSIDIIRMIFPTHYIGECMQLISGFEKNVIYISVLLIISLICMFVGSIIINTKNY